MDLPLELPDECPTFDGVRLRAFRDADVPMLLGLSRGPYVPATGSLPANATPEEALAYIERQRDRLVTGAGYSFCAAVEATDEAIGQAGLWLRSIDEGRATAGYYVAPAARGHGFAARSLTALTTFAWTVAEVERVELYIEPWNAASIKAAERAGFSREGLLRSHQAIGGQRVDMCLFAAVRPRASG